MGQRSQVYIRYKNNKNLVAMHLQWNYGHYMINRTYQLLDFISKNMKDEYNNFAEKNFEITNRDRKDIDILHDLIQMNTTLGSYGKGVDLVKEKYVFDEEDKDTFKMIPKKQDNNNGILVIDIQDNGKIKYGLGGGYEEVENMTLEDDFKMITARKYFELHNNGFTGEYEKYKLENQNKELYDYVMKQIDFIDNSFELLTDKEYKEIFDSEYEYKDCMSEEEIKSAQEEKELMKEKREDFNANE